MGGQVGLPDIALTASAVLLLLLAPGTLLARVGFREAWASAVALGPALSVVIIAAAAILVGVSGGFGLPVPGALMAAAPLVAALLALAARRWLNSRSRMTSQQEVEMPAALLGGAAAGSVLAAAVWGWPRGWITAPPQSWDYLWHQYVVSTISRRGLITPNELVPVDGLSTVTTYYQHGAHLIAGSAAGDSLAGTSAALNLLLWFCFVLVLPIGIAALTAAFTRSPAALVAAPIAAVLAADLVIGQLGLWSFAIGLCLAPGVLLAGLRFIRQPALTSAAPTVIGLAGLVLVHPQVYLGVAVVLGALLISENRASSGWVSALPRRSVPAALMLVGVLAVVITLPWQPVAQEQQTFSTALPLREAGFESIGSVVSAMLLGQRLGGGGPGSANPVLGLLVVGSVALLALRRRHLGVIVGYGALAVMTALTAAGPPAVREVIARPWLGDWYRPAALQALVAAVIVGLAVAEVPKVLPDSPAMRRSSAAVLTALLVAAVVIRVPVANEDVRSLYGQWVEAGGTDPADPVRDVSREADGVITVWDAEAMTELAAVTPADTRVLNWWPDGSPWMFGAEGLVPVKTYAVTSVDLNAAVFIERHMMDPDREEEVIDRLAELRVCSAYTSETYLPARDRPQWTMNADLPGFELVFENRSARVFRASHPRLTAYCS